MLPAESSVVSSASFANIVNDKNLTETVSLSRFV